MTHKISDQLLSRFSEFVTARFGLHFPKKRWRDLARKIVLLTDDFGFTDAAACIQWLISAQLTATHLDTLVCRLTIGETYFFRERKSFDALETRILPALIGSRREKEKRLRIWSAGCSTGEEAYSIAILLQRMIPDLPRWNITILATDVNPESLRKAVRGEYGDWSFRSNPGWVRDRYFIRNGEGRFQIADTTRNMITFAPLNLATDSYPSMLNNTNAMDVIFCRNVLMYFAPEQARRVVDNLRHCLVTGGWLAVSPCETSHTLFSRFETVYFQDTVFYRKDGSRKPMAVPPFEVAGGPTVPMPSINVVHEMAPGYVPPPPPAKPVTLTAVKRVQEEEPPASPYEQAQALYRQGEYAEAAAKLSAFLTNSPREAASPSYGKAATLLAQSFANQGNFAAALEWSEKAIASDRLNPQPYYLQATIFQEQGDAASAISSLKRALYLDHEFVLAHFSLANLTLRLGKIKEAAKHLENAASLLRTYCADDVLPGSEGMSARRLAEIIGATRESIG